MRILWVVFLVLCACSGPKKPTGIIAGQCGPTPVMAKDLETFGLSVPKNKVVVMRIFASWCPYCKEDLAELGGFFKNGTFTPQSVHVLLMSYQNSRENKSTSDHFVREVFPKFGIPPQAVQIVHVDKNFGELIKSKSAAGQTMFAGWQGVPFGLVFGKDGRLAFRGHFTTSPQFQDGHYGFIHNLTKENCSAPL